MTSDLQIHAMVMSVMSWVRLANDTSLSTPWKIVERLSHPEMGIVVIQETVGGRKFRLTVTSETR